MTAGMQFVEALLRRFRDKMLPEEVGKGIMQPFVEEGALSGSQDVTVSIAIGQNWRPYLAKSYMHTILEARDIFGSTPIGKCLKA
jgi:hypothetical protein